jgi:hypothetical protein
MSLVGQWTDKADYWKNSSQKQRWVASALLMIEPYLRRVQDYKYLYRLRDALRNEVSRLKGPPNKIGATFSILTNFGIDSE